MRIIYCFLICAACTVFTSCGPNYIFESEIMVEGSAWQNEEPIRFEFDATDLSSSYTLWLTLNHSADYAYENVYVKIRTEFPSQQNNEQVISLDIADKFGRWQGDCDAKRCLTLIPLQTNLRFKELGKHAITFVQETRSNPLEGINALALSIEKLKE